MTLTFSKHGPLVTVVAALVALTGCKSKSSGDYGVTFCSAEVESLTASLEEQVHRFQEALYAYQRRQLEERQLLRVAENTVRICEEFRSRNTGTFCLSQDRFSGEQVRIQRDLFIDECNNAASYLDHSGSWSPGRNDRDRHDRRDGSWADQPITSLKSREIALYIVDSQTVLQALSSRRNPLAFVSGKLVSLDAVKDATRRGQVACAVMTNKTQFVAKRSLPVVTIQDRSQSGSQQSYTLVTSDGFQASCQKTGRSPMTAREIQNAFGTAIQIRH